MRTPLAIAVVLLGLYGVLTVGAGRLLDQTADEQTAWIAGRLILSTGDWSIQRTWEQGPLGFVFNQLFTWGDAAFTREALARARLGMLVFGLLAGGLVFLWARRLFGASGGLVALACFVLHPLMFGYGALTTVDMAHAAGVLLLVFLLWRFAEDPRTARLVPVGVALGAALAIKYLVVLQVPLVAGVVAVCAFRRARAAGKARALVVSGASVALVAGLALLALHAAYGFRAGFAVDDPSRYLTDVTPRLFDLPGVGLLLHLLPAPFLRGADMYLWYAAQQKVPFLNGSFAPGHWSYYLCCVLFKTPEPILVAGAFVAARCVPRWLGGRAGPSVQRAAVLLVLAIGVPLFYQSFFSELQFGVRHILPLFPLGFVLLGGLLRDSWLAGRPRGWIEAALAVLILWTAVDVGLQWPDGLGYTNRIAGGPAESYRRFNDSNSDWGQLSERGLQQLRKRADAELVELRLGSGSRFGRVAIRVRDFVVPDPENPSRPRHWLDPFTPADHAGSSWLAFDVTPESFREAAEASGSERVWADYAVALLGDGRLDDAERALGRLSAPRAEPLRGLADRLREWEAAASPETAHRLARDWTNVGRRDLVIQLLSRSGLSANTTGAHLLAKALAAEWRFEEAIAQLQRRTMIGAEPDNFFLLDGLYAVRGRPRERIALLRGEAQRLPESMAPAAERSLAAALEDLVVLKVLERGRE